MSDNQSAIWKVLRDGQNQVNIKFWVNCSFGDPFCSNHCYENLKISRCGWRVICKNEVWRTATISDFENHPLDSKVYCGKRSRDILEVQDAIVSDDEPNPKHHQTQVQLRELE